MIKTVLFDLDGVLVDSCDIHYEALNCALLETKGFLISREDHNLHYNGLPTKVKLGMLKDKGLVEVKDFEYIESSKKENTLRIIEKTIKYDQSKVDLINFLHELKIKVAVVTNSIRTSTNLSLGKIGIYHLVDKIITNQDIKNPKPHPEGYIRGMIWAKSYPDQSIIVEDSPQGINAAKLTGAKVVIVKNATEVNINLIKNNL